jgi:hypothetical protein
MRVGYVPAATHAALRSRQRAGTPVTPAGAAIRRWTAAPHLVGRSRPENVMLADVRGKNGPVTAVLRAPVDNPGVFDHPLDHVPGMVLTEAARQIAVLATNDRRGSALRTRMHELDGTFARYVELDRPAILSARPSPATGPARTVEVEVAQDGIRAAHLVIGLTVGEG